MWTIPGRTNSITNNFILTANDGASGEAAGTAVSDIADTPGTPDTSDTPGTPDTPDTPETPDTPDTPGTPDTPDTPETSDEPDTPGTPDTPETPDESDAPEDFVSISENSLADGGGGDGEYGISLLADGDEFGVRTDGGDCGENLCWDYYDDTKTLVISCKEEGTPGRMADNCYSKWNGLNPKYLVVEEGVESIGALAFYNCPSLTGTIELPSTLTEIGVEAFYGGQYNYQHNQITEVTFKAKELNLRAEAFSNCDKLEVVHFADDLETLVSEANAFSGCTSLKEIRIPGSLGTITKEMGFGQMTSVKKIIVEEGIIEIGGRDDPSETGSLPTNNLVEVQLPNTLKKIGKNVFAYARNLQMVYLTGTEPEKGVAVKLPEGIEEIEFAAFGTCGERLEGKVILPSTLMTIGDYAFAFDTGITEVIFERGDGGSRTLNLGDFAFSGCAMLETIRFPDNLTTLTAQAKTYAGTDKLNVIQIPGSLKNLESGETLDAGRITPEMGFQYMPSVKKIIVGEGIKQIETGSLPTDKSNLLEVQLPTSLKEIPNNMFFALDNSDVSQLKSVYPTGTELEEGVAVKLPEGMTAIGMQAFYNCNELKGTIILPSTLKTIGTSAFFGCNNITGDLVLPDVKSIGQDAFKGCAFVGLHTGRKPVAILGPDYYNNFDGNPLRTVWFRGEDDGETIKADDGSLIDWSGMFSKIKGIGSVEKIYIDNTVDRLSDKNKEFWGNYADISFVGPNVVTFDKALFSKAPTPVSSLTGTYYVTEEGVLYALDKAARTASLSYCPPGVTELRIPSVLEVGEGLIGEADQQYAGKYRVVGVSRHAVKAASDLTTVNADDPQAITLSNRAFADCPTLTSVNGYTTQADANAIFGVSGTPAIKRAFVNTGLAQGTTPPSTQGKPMRSLSYTSINAGKLTVEIDKKNTYEYRDNAYRVLTGEGLSFQISAQAYGTSGAKTQFLIYFEAGDVGFTGMKTYTTYITYSVNGVDSAVTEPLTVTYDRVSACYCISFELPSGATTVLGWSDFGQEPVMYPNGTKGGGLTVWGEVVDSTGADGPDGTEENDEIFGGFSGNANYMEIDWETKRVNYNYYLVGRNQRAEVNPNTHQPSYPKDHGIAFDDNSNDKQAYFISNASTIESDKGTDKLTEVDYRYVVTLPAGMTWADDEVVAKCLKYWLGQENVRPLSISEDRRTLTCEFKDTYSEQVEITKRFSPFNLGMTGLQDSAIVIGDDWDYFKEDENKKIEYVCTPTMHYQFSEPATLRTETVYETLLPAEPGAVILSRKYETGKGRGDSMTIRFEAENTRNADAYLDLQEITDGVITDINKIDRDLNSNGYLYLTAEQMAKVVLNDNPYLEVEKIVIAGAALYNSAELSKFQEHKGTDGNALVKENLYTAYLEPSEDNVTLELDVEWPGETESDRKPTKLTLSVKNSQQGISDNVINILDSDTVDLLGDEIKEALEKVGYLIPTGMYQITWTATDAARTHSIGPYSDTENKSYKWEIGSYEATVKPDYLQGHRWLTNDSLTRFQLFPADSRYPTAQAVFTLGDNHTVEKPCYDRSYGSSEMTMVVDHYDSQTGEKVLTENNQSQWICPGVILDYQVSYKNGNNIPFGDMPFKQTFDSSQCLLAPVDKNEILAGKGYKKLSELIGSESEDNKFNKRDYYLLLPDQPQTLTGIWLGGEDESKSKDFFVDSIEIGGEWSEDEKKENMQTCIRWYEKTIDAEAQKQYRFYTYVLQPEEEGERPKASSVVYANNYIKRGNDTGGYSTRLYAKYNSFYQSENIRKDIIINPEKAGTPEEETPKNEQRSTYLGTGASVTYRLAFNEYWIGDYPLHEGELYDLLPCTYGAFEWKLGENVEVKYFLKERISQSGEVSAYEEFEPDNKNSARIEKVEPSVEGGKETGQYKLSFGSFTIPYNKTLCVYVTLTFPDGSVWEDFAERADVNLYNTLCYKELKSQVSHMIARPTQVFLKTGVYGTDGDPYGYIYSNSDEVDRIVKYYVVIYNHGKGYLYLNPVHIKIPKGFTLVDPPKSIHENGDWNLSDVSVTDQDPPANIVRREIGGVTVDTPESSANAGDQEAVLDIAIQDPLGNYNKDDSVGKYFLRPGEFVAMEVRFVTGGYQETEDKVDLPAAMPIDDSHHVGQIAQVQGVDAHRRNYVNSNEGTPEFWEDNSIAEKRGFTIPECADTGKWVASQVSLTREKAKPGVIKNAPTKMKKNDEVEDDYKPQEGVSLERSVKWETELVNGGSNSLTGYTTKDSVQWPYVFDGEVQLKSQIDSNQDKKFTIKRIPPEDSNDPVEQIDRDNLMVNGEPVEIAGSQDVALNGGDKYCAEVFDGAKVYFYKEDVFEDGEGRQAETMEIHFDDRIYGVGPASYQSGRVVEKKRVLSYWTRFDLSQKDNTARTSYANRMVIQPSQPYTKEDVCEGIAINDKGDPVNSDTEQPDGIMAVGYVSVNVGQSTAAWMEVKENKKDGGQTPEISDSIKEALTKENKILIGDMENSTVTYTMNVLNHVASGDPSDTVQSADDRKYSIEKMVIINTLPHEGDKMPFNSNVPRDSDYEIIAGSDNGFNISVWYYDTPADENSGHPKLKEIDENCYQILYNTSETVASEDWNFIEKEGENWNQTVPDDLAARGWKLADTNTDFSAMRSIRIEIDDPNKTLNVGDPEENKNYRSLMKAGRTIVVQYEAKVKVEKDEENGVVTAPTPGECAWNSFGYRFRRFDESAPMEASSIRTGVQIPPIPILYERLIDYNLNPYKNPGEPEEFSFTITKQPGTRENGNETKYGEEITFQQLSFSVTVCNGESEADKELRNFGGETGIILWNGEDEGAWDKSDFWEEGASYEVKQTGAPESLPLFSVKVNGQLTTSFVYDPLYEPAIEVKNRTRVWNKQMYKMDANSSGYDPSNNEDREKIKFLPNALFGLYTTDEAQKVDIGQITSEMGDRYGWLVTYSALLENDKNQQISYGEGDTAIKLYLKDYAVTDANGEIEWRNLEDDVYYVKELSPPPAYRLDETIHQINRAGTELFVYDEPGIRFPITGGVGTLLYYIPGVILVASNVIYTGRRGRRRKRKEKRKNAGRTSGRTRRGVAIKAAGGTITLAMAVKILARTVQIRKEKRGLRAEKKAHIKACKRTFRRRKREMLRQRRKNERRRM